MALECFNEVSFTFQVYTLTFTAYFVFKKKWRLFIVVNN